MEVSPLEKFKKISFDCVKKEFDFCRLHSCLHGLKNAYYNFCYRSFFKLFIYVNDDKQSRIDVICFNTSQSFKTCSLVLKQAISYQKTDRNVHCLALQPNNRSVNTTRPRFDILPHFL